MVISGKDIGRRNTEAKETIAEKKGKRKLGEY